MAEHEIPEASAAPNLPCPACLGYAVIVVKADDCLAAIHEALALLRQGEAGKD